MKLNLAGLVSLVFAASTAKSQAGGRETCRINFVNSAGTSTDLHGNDHKQTVNWRNNKY